MFFEGVQKYFVKMEKTWLNLKKSATRDAPRDATRADLAVRAKRNVQKKKRGEGKNTWARPSAPPLVHPGECFFDFSSRFARLGQQLSF